MYRQRMAVGFLGLMALGACTPVPATPTTAPVSQAPAPKTGWDSYTSNEQSFVPMVKAMGIDVSPAAIVGWAREACAAPTANRRPVVGAILWQEVGPAIAGGWAYDGSMVDLDGIDEGAGPKRIGMADAFAHGLNEFDVCLEQGESE